MAVSRLQKPVLAHAASEVVGFAKLDDQLAGSSLLVQGGLELVGFWALLLSMKGARGRIYESVPMLARRCATTKEKVRELLAILEATDPDSRTPDHDGRRIRIETEPRFCIVILNHAKYSSSDSTNAERQKRFREAHRNGRNAVTNGGDGVTYLPSTISDVTEGVQGEVDACTATCAELTALTGKPLDELLWEFSEFKGRRLMRLDQTAPPAWLRVTHDRIKAALIEARREKAGAAKPRGEDPLARIKRIEAEREARLAGKAS